MAFLQHKGARLHWREDGMIGAVARAPALLLLNAIGTDLHVWDGVVALLARDFRILRMDARGHGESGAGDQDGDYSLALLAGDALAVLDAAGVQKAAVCGLSLGGMIAMQMALAAPERVRALVLACTSAKLDGAAWQSRIDLVRAKGMAEIAPAALARFFAPDFAAGHPAAVERIKAGLLAQDAQAYAAAGAAIRDMALVERIGAIAVPTLVIAGTKDVSTPYDGHGSEIARRVPGAASVMLEAAHLAPIEAPDAFAAALRDFLHEDRMDQTEANNTLYQAGLKNRRRVLGDAWVDKSLAAMTPFNADFQAMITRGVWNEVWGRPGLDERTRRLLVLAVTAALGRWEEFRLHVRAGIAQGGLGEEDIKEVLLQLAFYAGVPAANTGFSEAASVLAALKSE